MIKAWARRDKYGQAGILVWLGLDAWTYITAYHDELVMQSDNERRAILNTRPANLSDPDVRMLLRSMDYSGWEYELHDIHILDAEYAAFVGRVAAHNRAANGDLHRELWNPHGTLADGVGAKGDEQ